MRDKFFLDSNILVYSSLQNDSNKHDKILHFLESIKGRAIFVSTQVVNEVYVTLLKHKLSDEKTKSIVEEIIKVYNISMITISTIKESWRLRKRYNLSYWDSLIVASALETECGVLYTEDMQDELVIDNCLTIKNPFK